MTLESYQNDILTDLQFINKCLKVFEEKYKLPTNYVYEQYLKGVEDIGLEMEVYGEWANYCSMKLHLTDELKRRAVKTI